MPKLPVVSGYDTVKAFSTIGYLPDHQTGSHMVLRHKDSPHRRLTIPNHRELSKGTLKAIIKQAGLTVEEFESIL